MERFKELRNYLEEQSLAWWSRQPISDITSRRSIPSYISVLPYRAQINIAQGRLVVPVKSAKEYGKWDDVPDYDKKAKVTAPNLGGYMTSYKNAGEYTVIIDWDEWDRFARDYFQSYKKNREVFKGYSKKNMIDSLLFETNAKFNCDCPSFYWQGMQFNATKQNSAIYPVTIGSKKWLPAHSKAGSNNPVCKHLHAVIAELYDAKSYLYRKMYREIQGETAFKNIMDVIFPGED